MTDSTADIKSLANTLATTTDYLVACNTVTAMVLLRDCTPRVLIECIEKGFALDNPDEKKLLLQILLIQVHGKGGNLIDLFKAAFSDSARKAFFISNPLTIYDEANILSRAFLSSSVSEQLYLMIRLLQEAKNHEEVWERENLIRAKLLPQVIILKNPTAEDLRSATLDAMEYGKRNEPTRYATCIRILDTILKNSPPK